ncbi:MAG: nucleotidyl transferase AbiEii/AbiGii toxin family protein [archaeon]
MITQQELKRLAATKGVDLNTMEKDYALTWTLKAISTNKILATSLLFKGGTCLSKIYAANYRLSEDLDFTKAKGINLTLDQIVAELEKAFEQIKNEGGPQLKVKEEHDNQGYIQLKIQYTAIFNQAGTLKLDISLSEHYIYSAMKKPLKEILYSDVQAFPVQCYHILEITVEKMRALFQRKRCRDYYDLWKLTTSSELKKQLLLDTGDLRKVLYEKCELNNISYKPELMFNPQLLEETQEYWEDSLKRLVKELPKFKEVIQELQETFFYENELSQFVNDQNMDHLDDINRGDETELLLRRAVELIIENTTSKKKKIVLDALGQLSVIYAYKKYAPRIPRKWVVEIARLEANEKDDEIKSAAKTVLDTLTKSGKIY